jgi:hypothetical protein
MATQKVCLSLRARPLSELLPLSKSATELQCDLRQREHESQLADLKKKLDELQLTVASLRGHSSSADSQPRYGRQSKVATTLALTCINHPL